MRSSKIRDFSELLHLLRPFFIGGLTILFTGFFVNFLYNLSMGNSEEKGVLSAVAYTISNDFLFSMIIAIFLMIVVLAIYFSGDIRRFILYRKPERYQRFEQIDSSKIKYGYVEFRPTLVAGDMEMKPKGAGIEILDRVFQGRLKAPSKLSSWDTIFDELERGEFDIIATPLYDVTERRKRMLFTVPIFYADIGVFTCRTNNKLLDARTKLEIGMKFNELMEGLYQLQKELIVRGCDGELQIKMAEKYLKRSEIIREKSNTFHIAAALDGLVEARDHSAFSDILFCERLQAEMHPLVQKNDRDGPIVNLLDHAELLFPVAFAMRKNEETLRKYINLRLMGIEGFESSGLSEMLIDNTMKLVGTNWNKAQVTDYFQAPIKIGNSPEKREIALEQENVFAFGQK